MSDIHLTVLIEDKISGSFLFEVCLLFAADLRSGAKSYIISFNAIRILQRATSNGGQQGQPS